MVAYFELPTRVVKPSLKGVLHLKLHTFIYVTLTDSPNVTTL